LSFLFVRLLKGNTAEQKKNYDAIERK
jgi:hypothetical protein